MDGVSDGISDESLMERVVGGDMDALGALFERYRQALFGFLSRLLPDRALAEDVLLDAFLRAYDRRRTYRTGMRFSTWLYAIAHNLAADALKRASRREIPTECPAHELPSRDDDPPAAEAERAELAHAVRDAVARLPADQRAVVILREYLGLNYREIAAVTGATEETARVRAHRARQALRTALAPYVQEEKADA